MISLDRVCVEMPLMELVRSLVPPLSFKPVSGISVGRRVQDHPDPMLSAVSPAGTVAFSMLFGVGSGEADANATKANATGNLQLDSIRIKDPLGRIVGIAGREGIGGQ